MSSSDRPSLEQATRALVRARQVASELGSAMAVTILDDGGHVIAAERMDGANAYAVDLSAHKALSAAKVNADTRAIRALFAKGEELDGLDAVFAGILVPLPGGFPVRRGGRLVAGVGVDGAGDERDERIALSALAVLEEAL